MNSRSLEAKIVVLGSQGVGKTSLVYRFVKGSFGPAISTVGAEFVAKKVVDDTTDTTIRLQIWDTAGQERFHSMARIYYRGAHACILCYSITDEKSFEEMGTWLTELRKHLPLDVIIHVVGTKSDVVEADPSLRKVPFERCIAYVAAHLNPNEGYTPPPTAMTGLSSSNSAHVAGGGGGYFGTGRVNVEESGAKSPSSKRSSGFWGQDVGWDSCHEVSAESGDGVDEVFRVISRKLVEQSKKKAEAERLALLGESANENLNGATPRLRPGTASFRVGRDRRSWYGGLEAWSSAGINIEALSEIEQEDARRNREVMRRRKGRKCC